MDPLTVAFHGLPKNADAAARSMLRLLLPLLGNRWRAAESPDSDVLILEAETLAEMRRSKSAREETLYIVFADENTPPTDAFATIQRPLNSARLVELLHMAQAELEKRSGLFGNTTVVTPGDSSSGQPPERSIRTSMRIAVRWTLQDMRRAVTFQHLDQAKILSAIPGVGFTTRLRSNALADLIRANKPVDLIELSEAEKNALRERRSFEPFSKLEWIYWLTGSGGVIHPELKVSRKYQLRKYPDFAVLPHYHSDVRMASLLKAEPMTVGELAQHAGVRLETACNFVNACSALGFLGRPKALVAQEQAAARARGKADDHTAEDSGGLIAPLRRFSLFRRFGRRDGEA